MSTKSRAANHSPSRQRSSLHHQPWSWRRLAAIVAALLLALTATVATSASATAAPAVVKVPKAVRVAGQPDLGSNVFIFTPSMPQSQIQATVDAISTLQVPNQFGSQRYALLFEPGTYGSAADPLVFQVGYYTEVAGLGKSPGDVTINGSIDVYNQCFPTTDGSSNCIALDNFWRSLSNLTIDVTGQTGCQANTEFWAVSQAAPMRRVAVNGGVSLMDYCSAGPQYASGGFIADSAFTGGTIINGSQQQFFVRNSNLDGWSNGVWNQVFAGDVGAPAQSFSPTSGLAGGTAPYTTLATNRVTQEEPYLYTDTAGNDRVFLPAVQRNSTGTTWAAAATPGRSESINRFFIADPTTPVSRINRALRDGKNLLLTPGVYALSEPIDVRRADTVVLGLGFATLVPERGTAALHVAGVDGVKLSGLIIDAGPKNSPALLQLDPTRHPSASDPTLVQDVFFRIGGARAGKATNSLVVGSSDTILDDIWAWRADHGTGVGWQLNTAAHGLVVTGDNVTAYGLFVEHYQKTQVIWTGANGEDVFFQSEMPYDPPSQAAWKRTAATDGYPSFLVGSQVKKFQGYGMGTYCFFDLGVPIEASRAYQVPRTPGVGMHDLLTRFLSGAGGIEHVVNDTGAPVTSASPGPSDVVDYP